MFPQTVGGQNVSFTNCLVNQYGATLRHCRTNGVWKSVENNCQSCPNGQTSPANTATISGCAKSGSGNLDPHFSGFNGEKMEVKKDDRAANQLFHLYCSKSVTITSLFYEYPDKLLFMTKFWVRLGNTLFTLSLSTKPRVLSFHEPAYFLPDLGRYRIDIEDGHLEWDDDKLRVTYGYLKMNFVNKIYLNGSPYMNIEIFIKKTPTESDVTGIIGRTLHQKMTDADFEEYLQFKASVDDVLTFTCNSVL
jgi:hypothetical protein